MIKNKKEENNLPIEDMQWHAPDSRETGCIQKNLIHSEEKRFQKRCVYSLIIAAIVIVMEALARFMYMSDGVHSRRDTIPGMIILIFSAFIIYNLISFIYTKVKINIHSSSSHCECMEGVITHIFDSHDLSKKAHENVPNYILFHNEQGNCTTALPVKDPEAFSQIKEGDEILVIKESPMGRKRYSFLLKKQLDS